MPNITSTCDNCLDTFSAATFRARYCEDACRYAARNARSRRERAQLQGALRNLADVLGRVDDVLEEHATPTEYAQLTYLAGYARRLSTVRPRR